MNPHEAIQKINQAMCNDDLEAAEKALEQYACLFAVHVVFNVTSHYSTSNIEKPVLMSGTFGKDKTPQEIYSLFTNQS